jgi:hypothetical protein
VRQLRLAANPYAPTTERVTAARAGADLALVDSEGLRGWNLARVRLQGLWDTVGRGAGIELETVFGISTKRAASGGFLGLTIGDMPSTSFLFQIEVGAQWEVGR